MDIWNTVDHIESKYEGRRLQNIGICRECKYLGFRKTKLNNEFYVCNKDSFKEKYQTINPNAVDPVIECSEYYPKNQLTLDQMFELAWSITKRKIPIGFGYQEEVTITKPKEEEE